MQLRGPDNWSWLVKWILSSIFKITQLFSFLKNKTGPAGGWEFPAVTQEVKAWRQVWVGRLEEGGQRGEAGAALARGNFLLGTEALGMVLPMSGLSPKEAYLLLCFADM